MQIGVMFAADVGETTGSNPHDRSKRLFLTSDPCGQLGGGADPPRRARTRRDATATSAAGDDPALVELDEVERPGLGHPGHGHRGGVGYEADVYESLLRPSSCSAPAFSPFPQAGTAATAHTRIPMRARMIGAT